MSEKVLHPAAAETLDQVTREWRRERDADIAREIERTAEQADRLAKVLAVSL